MSHFKGTLLNVARDVSPFQLMGIDGEVFNLEGLQGNWTLVFFGFTHCGSLCPTTMAQLAKMHRILETKEVKALPKVVMISIDPERDDQEALAHYVQAFSPHFYGAIGDKKVVQAMTREFGIAYAKVAFKGEDTENYDIEHTGTILLFNPQGQLSAFFTLPHKAENLANDYLLLSSKYF